MKRTIFLLSLILVVVVGIVSVQAEPDAPDNRSIYIFGDSWAEQMSETGSPIPFDQAIVDNEFDSFVTLHKHGISGSTLEQWATNENGILLALTTAIVNDSSSDPIVFFTLGGNDVFAGASAQEMATNLATILTALEATRPDLQIVQGGYDILNPNVNPAQCLAAMQFIFGSTDPAVVNTAVLTAYQDSATVVDAFDRATIVNTFGSLQGTPGNPTINEWSPVQYLSDCIHLNTDGYNIYLDTLFNEQLSPELCSDPLVIASACPSDTYIYLPLLSR